MKIRRSAVSDQLRHEDESVVLVGDVVVHLSAISTAIFEVAKEWIGVAELAERLEERFGPAPGGAETAIERALVELHGQGLIERG